MRTTRVLVAAGLALAVAASTAHAHAGVALDGKRHTHATYTATLDQTTVPTDSGRLSADPTTPSLSDCTSTSCDRTPLRLTVPRGTSAGRLTISVLIDSSMNAYVALYDTKGRSLAAADLADKAKSSDWQNRQLAACCGTEYVLDLAQERIRPGWYELVVFNRGGFGSFTADLEFKAHPADRPITKR